MTTTTPDQPLSSISRVVVLVLENRSFDHMLGFLYTDAGNVSPAGQPFDGLTGVESNSDSAGHPVTVMKIDDSQANAYFLPGADPGEGYRATNAQLFSNVTPPLPAAAAMTGFVTNFSSTLASEQKEGTWDIVAGTTEADIMGAFTPEALPVLSGLARGYAVCDRWFSSVPTETMPNRAFLCAATSQGHMDDVTKSYTAPTIFGLLDAHGIGWSIFGYDAEPLTRLTFSDTTDAPDSHFGKFPDFTAACAAGTLAPFSFLEPSWGSTGNSQHPNYDVALGEQLIYDVYSALRRGPQWASTLLIITYDEHGGCYDHVSPPVGAVAPDSSAGEYGFDFRRFGVRVPTVLVSPLIEAGTVFRVPEGAMPLDHTSILKTVERRFGLPALTARDRAAPDFAAVLARAAPRSDDPLAGVVVPTASGKNPAATRPSHLQRIYAELAARLPVPGDSGEPGHVPQLETGAEYGEYGARRVAEWKAARAAGLT